MLARRVQGIGFSPTLGIAALARRLRAEGVDVLDFSAGQPDFPTPDAVKEAAKHAIDDNRTRYTNTEGIEELRQAIVRRIQQDLGLEYAPEQVLVSPGAKASLFFACMALIDPGDEVLVPSPHWSSYPEQVRLAGGEPVLLPCAEERGFKLTAAQLEGALSPRTRVLMLNYPSNPTGACYSREELEPLAEVCVRRKLWVLSDEIYSKLLYDGRTFTSMTQLGSAIRERTLLIDGVSKTYSMTGWRIGYAVGPQALISGMAKLQSHVTSNATSISQWASVAALEMSGDELARRVADFTLRRDEMVRRLRELPGVACAVPEGAFYAFPNVSRLFGNGGTAPIHSGHDLAKLLLDRARVAVVPGEAFGSKSHLRMSYAVPIERVREGMERIAEALRSLVR